MKKTIASATFLLLGAGAAAVGANYKGSDTMEDVVKFMLAGAPFCPGTTGITYDGGGSGGGENAMTGAGSTAITQSSAPMSRALGVAAVCATAQGSPSTTAGIFTCLDGVAIVASAERAPSCQLKYPAITPTQDWKDVVRLVYTGANASPDNAGAGSAANCGSAARLALVNNWGSLFQTTCTQTGSTACAQLQHAFRRNDLSGTTDTFLSLFSLPTRDTNPFCNGVGRAAPISLTNTTDFDDNDPIRRPCLGSGNVGGANGEQVCNRPKPGADQNTLGLVQVTFVPETGTNLTQEQAFPTVACATGQFAWKDHPSQVPLCPYGNAPVVGTCLIPFATTPTNPNFSCINRSGNRGFFLSGTTPAGDGRIYNLFTRSAPAGAILRDGNSRRLIGSFYKLHTNSAVATGVGGNCQLPSATDQIGCFVAANPCSIGFSGREASRQPGANALGVKGIFPTIADIQNLVLNPSIAYPVSRKLYFNSVVNPNIATLGTAGTLEFRQQQAALKTCFADAAKAKTACETYGFVEAPSGPQCEDFNEQANCGAATNNIACP